MTKNVKTFINKAENLKYQKFNNNWKFYLGDQKGAQFPYFDDSHFDYINIPHDYSINEDYNMNLEAQSGYKPGGCARYRKNFILNEGSKDKRYYIYFDGVYMNSTFYINGHKLGFHSYGYSPFVYDMTEFLDRKSDNIISIHLDHKTPSSRRYSGSGIMRDIYIIIADNLHFDPYGVKINSSIDKKDSEVSIESKIINRYSHDKEIKIKHTIYDNENNIIKEFERSNINIPKYSTYIDKSIFNMENIKLWAIENPYLYNIKSEIIEDNKQIDYVNTDYGFRVIDTDPNLGLFLNGKNIKIKGVCMHTDIGALGACDYYTAIERQVDILKEMGTNTIRVTHNPCSKNLVDICNKKGILIVEEIFDGRIMSKNNNYNDFSNYFDEIIGESYLYDSYPNMTHAEYSLKSTIKRDYNAPSVFMYSIGNELLEGTDRTLSHKYPDVARNLIKRIREIDNHHLITLGDNIIRYEYRKELIKIDEEITKSGGMIGLNYTNDIRYDDIHKNYPHFTLRGSETASAINSRSVYDRYDINERASDKKLTSYDKSSVGWGRVASNAWFDVITRDFIAGEAVWTGFDYIGEPTPYNGIERGNVTQRPSPRSSYFGIVDLAGFVKDSYYFYRSQRKDDSTTLHLLPSWNKEEVLIKDKKVKVVCYTNAKKVELIFIDKKGNERSLGYQEFDINKTPIGHIYKTVRGKTGHTSLYMEFLVEFKEGTIKAIAYDENYNVINNTVGRNIIKTTGRAYKILAYKSKEKIANDKYDLCFIEIDIVDKDNNLITNAENLINVEVKGNGSLLALDNGFQADDTLFNVNNKKAFGGKLLAIVSSNGLKGDIDIKITSDGLIEENLQIKTMGEYKKTPQSNYPRYQLVKDIEDLDLSCGSDFLKIGYDNYIKYNGIDKNGDNISIYVNKLKDNYQLLNYSTATMTKIVPKLPQMVELVDNKAIPTNVYIEVVWEEIREDEVVSENILLKKGNAELFGKELTVIATIRVDDEKQILATDISSIALIKEKKEKEIVLGYATQQVFGKVIVNVDKDPQIKIYRSETRESKSLLEIDTEVNYKENKFIYNFKPTPATYIIIKTQNNELDIEDIELFSVKKLFKPNQNTEFESIKIGGYYLSEEELSKDYYKIDVEDISIKDIEVKSKDNAAITIIDNSKKIIILLISEDGNKIRKLEFIKR